MASLKTRATKADVAAFLASVPHDGRRADGEAMLALMSRITGWRARMWGPTIVGFGRYDYSYDSGHSGSMCVTGFSPRKANLVVYPGVHLEEAGAILDRLGPHKTGKGCLYLTRLEKVDIAVLEELIRAGIANISAKWPVAAE